MLDRRALPGRRTTPATPCTSAASKFVLHLIPSGILHPGRALRDRQWRRARSADAVHRDRRAGRSAGIDVDGRLSSATKRAPRPAVSPRARRAARGAPRRAQDRHHVARHRAGLRGQDRAPRRARAATSAIRSALRERGARATSTRATASSASSHAGLRSRCSTSSSRSAERLRAVARPTSSLVPARARCKRRGRAARRRAGHAARHRSRHVSVRDVVATRRPAACAPALGVAADARSTACSASPRRTRRASATGRCRRSCPTSWATRLRETGQEFGAVDRAAAPLRLVRRGRRALRGARRTDSTRLALTKLDVLDGLEQIEVCTAYKVRRPDPHRSARRSPGPRGVRAGVRDTPGLDVADTRGAPLRDLPDAARAYVRRLEEVSGVPAAIISTGSDRDETILRTDSVLSRWFGA